MSHYMTALAMRQKDLKPGAKIVLYWLADHHNGETGQCNPSINRLAECCEMSRRSVENHISSLEASGLIEVQAQYRTRGGKAANSYTLRLSDSDTQNLRMGYAKSAHGVCAKSAHDRTLEDTNLGNEQPPTPSRGGNDLFLADGDKRQEESQPDDMSLAVKSWNDEADKHGWPRVKKLTAGRKRSLKARINDAGGIDGWRSAVRRVASSDFLRTSGSSNWFCFDWLCKDSNFTKLLEGRYDNRGAEFHDVGDGPFQFDPADPFRGIPKNVAQAIRMEPTHEGRVQACREYWARRAG